MHDHEVYSPTPQGQQELRGAATTLSASELEVLVRIDGILTLGQIRRGMSREAMVSHDQALFALLRKGLVAPVRGDSFSEGIPFDFQTTAWNLAGAEADACTASLQNTNYYVRIARHRTAPRQRAPGERRSVLVVDDEPQLAQFLSHYLTFEGFDVRLAANRAEVVAELRKPLVPDLLLLDVMLPDADGFDILLRVRAHPALKDVPIIMLTAKTSRESVLKGLAGGADGYVTKPVEIESLLQAVRTVTGTP